MICSASVCCSTRLCHLLAPTRARPSLVRPTGRVAPVVVRVLYRPTAHLPACPSASARLQRWRARATVSTGSWGSLDQDDAPAAQRPQHSRLPLQPRSGRQSGKAPHEPPPLTIPQLQRLTELHKDDTYECGVVGSAAELAHRLRTSLYEGLHADEEGLAERASRYGTNSTQRPPQTTFWQLLQEALQDFTVLILLGAGLTSLMLEFLIVHPSGPGQAGPNWIEGASILAAVVVVVLVTALNNYQKETQFQALQAVEQDVKVRVIRDGQEQELPVQQVLVGELLLVEAGDILCADGLLVQGSDVRADESHLTGESDDRAKDPVRRPALLSGSKIVSGFGRMLVTSVGVHSQQGAIAELIARRRGASTFGSSNLQATEASTGSSSPGSSLNASLDVLAEQQEQRAEARQGGGLREETLLQQKLAEYATVIGKLGLAAALLAWGAMTLRFTWETFLVGGQPWEWAFLEDYLRFFITGVTIVVVAVPEGLPLAVTLSLAFSVKQMLADNNLVRHLSAAETMGTANVICSDKTGTLTQNDMCVTRLWLAGTVMEDLKPFTLLLTAASASDARAAAAGASRSSRLGSITRSSVLSSQGSAGSSMAGSSQEAAGEAASLLPLLGSAQEAAELLCQAIALNSTATLCMGADGQQQPSGNRTEVALLQLAALLGCDAAAARRETQVLAQVPFSSERKRMTTVIVVPERRSSSNGSSSNGSSSSDGSSGSSVASQAAAAPSGSSSNGVLGEGEARVRVLCKGAAEVLLEQCSHQLMPGGQRKPLDSAQRQRLLHGFAAGGQRVLALAYRDLRVPRSLLPSFVPGGPPTATPGSSGSDYGGSASGSHHSVLSGLEGGVWGHGRAVRAEQLEHELTLLAVVGLEDPLRPEVPAAIRACNRAGVTVKMLTGDNPTTATAIAQECGILPPHDTPSALQPAAQGGGGTVMVGEDFRARVLRPDGSIDSAAFLDIWPRMRVLARCSPTHKYTLVTAARALTDDIVAVTGDGTNDAPALRAANVGFAMNAGTDVAKEAADIVLLDNNFASIVSAALWGRNVYANITRFLQFQLTTNLVAVATAVTGAVVSSESPLTAVQMLWVNLIMDSLASVALATEPPDARLLNLPPFSREHQFMDLSQPTAKHVLGQAAWQLAVMYALVFAPHLLGVPNHGAGPAPSEHYTMVFNAFVLMQLFNQVNARKILDSEHIWEGLREARIFNAVLGAEFALQVLIVQFGGMAFSTHPLSLAQWAICLGIGSSTLVVRELLRRLPLGRWWFEVDAPPNDYGDRQHR